MLWFRPSRTGGFADRDQIVEVDPRSQGCWKSSRKGKVEKSNSAVGRACVLATLHVYFVMMPLKGIELKLNCLLPRRVFTGPVQLRAHLHLFHPKSIGSPIMPKKIRLPGRLDHEISERLGRK